MRTWFLHPGGPSPSCRESGLGRALFFNDTYLGYNEGLIIQNKGMINAKKLKRESTVAEEGEERWMPSFPAVLYGKPFKALLHQGLKWSFVASPAPFPASHRPRKEKKSAKGAVKNRIDFLNKIFAKSVTKSAFTITEPGNITCRIPTVFHLSRTTSFNDRVGGRLGSFQLKLLSSWANTSRFNKVILAGRMNCTRILNNKRVLSALLRRPLRRLMKSTF